MWFGLHKSLHNAVVGQKVLFWCGESAASDRDEGGTQKELSEESLRISCFVCEKLV